MGIIALLVAEDTIPGLRLDCPDELPSATDSAIALLEDVLANGNLSEAPPFPIRCQRNAIHVGSYKGRNGQ